MGVLPLTSISYTAEKVTKREGIATLATPSRGVWHARSRRRFSIPSGVAGTNLRKTARYAGKNCDPLQAAFGISQQRNQSVLVNPSAGQIAAGAVGQGLSQTGTQITRRNLNVQPTIKVPVGYKFTVRVNRDIVFESPYESVGPRQ